MAASLAPPSLQNILANTSTARVRTSTLAAFNSSSSCGMTFNSTLGTDAWTKRINSWTAASSWFDDWKSSASDDGEEGSELLVQFTICSPKYYKIKSKDNRLRLSIIT